MAAALDIQSSASPANNISMYVGRRSIDSVKNAGIAIDPIGISSDKLLSIIEDRDQLWRDCSQHQLQLLQQEHASTLRGLHAEISKLQAKCFDYRYKQAYNEPTITLDYNENIRKSSSVKDDEIERLNVNIQDLKNRLNRQDDEKSIAIRNLTLENARKTAQIYQLTQQVDQLKTKLSLEKEQSYRLKSALAINRPSLSESIDSKNGRFSILSHNKVRTEATFKATVQPSKNVKFTPPSASLFPPIDAKNKSLIRSASRDRQSRIK